MIEWRRRLIAVDIPDSEESAEDYFIVNDDAALDEEDGSALVWAGITEDVEDMQKAFKYSSIYYYMLKPSHLLTQGFVDNRKEHGNLFKHMCNFGAW